MSPSEIARLRSVAETCKRDGLTRTERELAEGTLRLLGERAELMDALAEEWARGGGGR